MVKAVTEVLQSMQTELQLVSVESDNLAIDNAAGCAIAATSNSVLIFNGTNNFNNSTPGGHGVVGVISIEIAPPTP